VVGEPIDVCPKDGTKLVIVREPGPEGRLEYVHCMGDTKHVFAVIREGGTDPPRYRLGEQIEPSD
jgi:hypothetical protein